MLLGPTSGANADVVVRTAAPLEHKGAEHRDRVVPLGASRTRMSCSRSPSREPGRNDALDHASKLGRDGADAESQVGRDRSIDTSNYFGLPALQVAADVHGPGNLACFAWTSLATRCSVARSSRV